VCYLRLTLDLTLARVSSAANVFSSQTLHYCFIVSNQYQIIVFQQFIHYLQFSVKFELFRARVTLNGSIGWVALIGVSIRTVLSIGVSIGDWFLTIIGARNRVLATICVLTYTWLGIGFYRFPIECPSCPFVCQSITILESGVWSHEIENQWAHSCSHEQECAPQKAQTRTHPLSPSILDDMFPFPIMAHLSVFW